MKVIPAVDLRGGACVQLVGGSYQEERVRIPDPMAAVERWLGTGFPMVHLIDLDAATEAGSNLDLVTDIVTRYPGVIQVGGGIRSTESVQSLFDAGAARVIVGTRALGDAGWLEQICAAHPGQIVVAADVRYRTVTTHGWNRTTPIPIQTVLARLAPLPLAGVLVTAVHVEGMQDGPDLPLVAEVMDATTLPVQAAGGITSLEDLTGLAALGVAGCLIGMALYTGALPPDTIGEEYRT